jgi:predicted ester cyclase
MMLDSETTESKCVTTGTHRITAQRLSFRLANPQGGFGKIEATGKKVQVPGCSFYEYDLESRKIPAGRIRFDFATLLRQIGAGA